MSKVQECPVHKLHPTQITVGMIEVADKEALLRGLNESQRREFLAAHFIPAVKGPDDKLYVTDHHHLGRALVDLGLDTGFFLIEADLSSLDPSVFWPAMEQNKWVHPYDENGILRAFGDIPKYLQGLRDDPYRSLAAYVRNAGGYKKTPEPFAEFLWADFFRQRLTVGVGREVWRRWFQ